GRVTHESHLPGLNAWARVRDWRVGRIQEMANVEVFPGSRLTAEDILEFSADDKFGFSHVFLATGA
ncbi:MAG TPA: trimethylamine dehydrogenase, partial [Planctomycetaceae bacterium]|nr:trimethylamine dehydrogenase [Planctomycetaceae bacterium]